MKCFVIHSMSPALQQAYWRSIGEEFEVRRDGLYFKEHRMSEFGNCQRCGWRPKREG
jgi:hypothetical protein